MCFCRIVHPYDPYSTTKYLNTCYVSHEYDITTRPKRCDITFEAKRPFYTTQYEASTSSGTRTHRCVKTKWLGSLK